MEDEAMNTKLDPIDLALLQWPINENTVARLTGMPREWAIAWALRGIGRWASKGVYRFEPLDLAHMLDRSKKAREYFNAQNYNK
jgi:hypothetical protein